VRKFADKAGIGMPEVGIFEGDPNAFATGAFKNSALVAVSTGLLQGMTREEVEAVIGHEVAHIANGDMVTMTLIQGVMNTFVVFLSRVIGYAVDSFLRKNDENSSGPGIGYYVTTIVLDIVLGFLAAIIVAWFSRQREFRADAGAAQLMGRRQPMINALARLGGMHPGELPKSVAAMGIAGGIGKLFSTHPPIEERIAALQAKRLADGRDRVVRQAVAQVAELHAGLVRGQHVTQQRRGPARQKIADQLARRLVGAPAQLEGPRLERTLQHDAGQRIDLAPSTFAISG
jgi:heat shock protein HtpX